MEEIKEEVLLNNIIVNYITDDIRDAIIEKIMM